MSALSATSTNNAIVTESFIENFSVDPIDTSKFSFGVPVENDKGGKDIKIFYNGGSPVFFGPNDPIVPFGTSTFDNKKFTVDVNVKKEGMFSQNISALDSVIKKFCKENSLAWLGKKSLSDAQIDVFFNKSIKEHSDHPDRYDPKMKLKLPFYDGKKRFKLYDENAAEIASNDITRIIVAGSVMNFKCRVRSIWVVDGSFGVTYELQSAQIFSPKKIDSFLLDIKSTMQYGRDIVVLPETFDPSLVSFGAPKDLERGVKLVPILYNGKSLVLRTTDSLRVPFGASHYEESDKYKVNVDLVDDSFQRALVTLDGLVKQAVCANPKGWGMKKNSLSEEEFACFHRECVKPHKKDGEVTNLYAPKFSFSLPFMDKDNKEKFMLFDANKTQIAVSKSACCDLIPRRSQLTGLVRACWVCVTAKSVSVSFELVQAQLFIQEDSSISDGYLFRMHSGSAEDHKSILEQVKQEVDELANSGPSAPVALERSISISPAATSGATHSVQVEDSDEEIAVEE